jgi:uncharacterized phosphosugar-binding protein
LVHNINQFPTVQLFDDYFEGARRIISQIEQTQMESVARAVDICVHSIMNGCVVHLFGSGHSRMAVEEMYPRYGSFAGFHPMVELSLTNHHNVVGSNGQWQAISWKMSRVSAM